MITTTLNNLQNHLSNSSFKKLLSSLKKKQADDEMLPLEKVVDILGLEKALLGMEAIQGYDETFRLYSCSSARTVLPVLEKIVSRDTDPRSHQAVEEAEKYLRGQVTPEDLATTFDEGMLAAITLKTAWEAWLKMWESENQDVLESIKHVGHRVEVRTTKNPSEAKMLFKKWVSRFTTEYETKGAIAAALSAAHTAAKEPKKAVNIVVNCAVEAFVVSSVAQSSKNEEEVSKSAKAKAWGLHTYEFVRMCRLDGEYGNLCDSPTRIQ